MNPTNRAFIESSSYPSCLEMKLVPVFPPTTPSFTLSGTCRAQGGTADGANFTSGLALINANTNHTGAALRVTGSSNLANDRGYNLQIKANGTKLIFDAEL